LGDNYEAQIAEDAIARLTAPVPSIRRSPSMDIHNLDRQMDQHSTDKESNLPDN
jgi:hypothetical protein